MKIYVGFSTGSSLFSRLIRWASDSNVSHTYLRIPIPRHEKSLIFQASGMAVNLESEKIFWGRSKTINEFECELSPEQAHALETFILEGLGVPYSIQHIVGMVWVLLCRGMGFHVKNPLSEGGHAYVCVEVVAKVLGIKGAEEMTPQDLLDHLRAHPSHLAPS